jgi:hypothetical protein
VRRRGAELLEVGGAAVELLEVGGAAVEPWPEQAGQRTGWRARRGRAGWGWRGAGSRGLDGER